MKRTEIFDKLKNVLGYRYIHAKKMKVESLVGPPVYLVEDLGLDSLDIVEMVMMIEDEFDIEIDDKEWGKGGGTGGEIKTVTEAVYLIEKLLKAKRE